MATPTNFPTPAVSGQILTAAYVNQLAGAFRVLQVVYGTTSTQVLNATSTYATTGLSATITPQSTTNKILVIQNVQGFTNSANTEFGLRITRLIGGTPTSLLTNSAALSSSTGTAQSMCTQIYLDSPASIAAVTYRADFAMGGAGSVYAQLSSNPSTMILMEISA